MAFYHEPYAISIVEHPLASRLPKAAKGKPQIIENTTDFLALMRRPGGPEFLQDYLQSDLPALGEHVVTFTDATLITLTCSHLLIDFVGIKSLFDAWSLVLQGRESELPPVHDIETCPMETLGNDQKEPYEHAGKLLSPLKMGILGLRLVWNMLWQWMAWEEEAELRLICVPGPYMKSLRNAALLDLAARKSEDGSAPFVSEGDVLLAWWAQHLAPHVSTSSKQTISIIIIFELRALLMAKGLLTSGSAYLGNAHSYVPVFVPASDVLTGSLGDVASALRQALITLGTKEQVEAFVSLRHTMSEDRFVLGDAGMTVVVGTNGTKAKIYDTDFSKVLVKEGPHMGGQQAGRPSLVYSHNFEPRQNSLVKTLYITGKDANGDYWLYTRLKKGVWDQINQAICNEASIIESK